MGFKRILHFLCVVLGLFVCQHSSAYDFKVGAIYYSWNQTDNTLTVTHAGGYSGSYQGNIVIPEVVEHNSKTLPVTTIGEWAFNDCTNLTSVKIGKNVKTIGEYAFQNCSNLTEITIPANVMTLDNYIFNGCTKIKYINVEDSEEPLSIGISYYYNLYGQVITSIFDYIGDNSMVLENIYLGRNLTSSVHPFEHQAELTTVTIGKYVTQADFTGCTSIGNVISNVTDPYSCTPTFETPVLANAILTVPVGTKSDYEAATTWSFWNPIEGTSTSGNSELSVSNYKVTAIYDATQGQVSLQEANGTVTINITPKDGYEVGTVTVKKLKDPSHSADEGDGIDDFTQNVRTRAAGDGTLPIEDEYEDVAMTGSGNVYSFTMPEADVIVTVTFVEETVPPTYTLKVSKDWVTFYSPVSFAVPEGLEAYIMTSVNSPENGLSGTAVLSKEEYVVAETPMLLRKIGTSTQFLVTKASNASLSDTPCSEYKGTLTSIDINSGCYILIDGTFVRSSGGTLKAYNCYLDLSGSRGARLRSIILNFGESGTTGIKEIGSAVLEDCQWFNLDGVRSENPSRGIYVKNGKKVVVK